MPDDVRSTTDVSPTILLNLSKWEHNVRQEADQRLLHGIHEQAQDYGWKFLNAELTSWDIPAALPPQGAIIRDLPDSRLAEKLRAIGCPTVRIGLLPHPLDHMLPAVIHDVRAKGDLAAEYFAEHGFRQVGYIGRDPWGNFKSLFEAFQKRGAELGLDCHLLQINQEARQKTAADVVQRYRRRAKVIGDWLHKLPKPVAILNHNDFMGGKVCVICTLAGMAVPEDVAVLGVGNHIFDCEAAMTPLSSIDLNEEEIGREATRLLHRLITGQKPPVKAILIPPKEVVERHSTDVMAVEDPVVARALRFIWDNLDSPLTVNDVAEQIAVSQSKLKRAFRRHLGRGVNAELRRKRLERSAELLVSTEMTVADIATATGFTARPYFFRAFRQAHGMTPHQYRRQHRSG